LSRASPRVALVAAGWCWALAIVWLSLTPSPPEVDFQSSDKVGHFGAYLLLMLWFSLLYRTTTARVPYAAGFLAMGIALEAIQGATGYRSFEWLDVAANGLGVLAGWAVAALAPRILAR
jgi:VanZ family protein